jgi:hypothetical protein
MSYAAEWAAQLNGLRSLMSYACELRSFNELHNRESPSYMCEFSSYEGIFRRI